MYNNKINHLICNMYSMINDKNFSIFRLYNENYERTLIETWHDFYAILN